MNAFFLKENIKKYCKQLRTESINAITSYRKLQDAGMRIAYNPRLSPSGLAKNSQSEMEINECGIYLPPPIRCVAPSDYDLIDIETNEQISSGEYCVIYGDLTNKAKAFFDLLREEDNPDLYDYPFLDTRV